jgi:hypothetical protein
MTKSSKHLCFFILSFGHSILFRIDPFGKLRPDFVLRILNPFDLYSPIKKHSNRGTQRLEWTKFMTCYFGRG